MDYIDIGSVPSGEDCAQVGTEGYFEKGNKECRAFLNQLRRQFGVEPLGARLKIKTNQHDFGPYQEVVCCYDENNQAAANYALKLESEMPEHWDEESLRELKLVQL